MCFDSVLVTKLTALPGRRQPAKGGEKGDDRRGGGQWTVCGSVIHRDPVMFAIIYRYRSHISSFHRMFCHCQCFQVKVAAAMAEILTIGAEGRTRETRETRETPETPGERPRAQSI